MPVRIIDAGGVTRTLSGIRAVDGSVVRTIRRALILDADGETFRTVASFTSAMQATANPGSVYGGASSGTVTTNSATVSVTGGVAPYAFAWTLESRSGEGSVPVVNSPNAAATSFRQSGLQIGDISQAIFRCAISDSAENTASVAIDATFQNTNFQ